MQELTVEYRGETLRVNTVIELIRAQEGHQWLALIKCARHYKERAFEELFPHRSSMTFLSVRQRQAVHNRAIELALEDALGIAARNNGQEVAETARAS